MKLNIGKRILMFFHWLLSLLGCAALAAYLIRPELVREWYGKAVSRLGLGDNQIMIIGIALLAVYTVLTVAQACIIFHRNRRADRGFITVDASDTGRVRIAISAIEQMVRQSVHSIDGIADMKIGIENADDAIVINIIASIVNGSHVPTITMNMQRAIRQFVEMNCGVAVRSVFISINNVTTSGDSPKRRRGKHGEAAAVPAAPAVEPASHDYAEIPKEEPPRAETEPEVRPITLTLDPPTAPDVGRDAFAPTGDLGEASDPGFDGAGDDYAAAAEVETAASTTDEPAWDDEDAERYGDAE